MPEIKKKILIEILVKCGKIRCGVVKLQQSKTMTCISLIRQVGLHNVLMSHIKTIGLKRLRLQIHKVLLNRRLQFEVAPNLRFLSIRNITNQISCQDNRHLQNDLKKGYHHKHNNLPISSTDQNKNHHLSSSN